MQALARPWWSEDHRGVLDRHQALDAATASNGMRHSLDRSAVDRRPQGSNTTLDAPSPCGAATCDRDAIPTRGVQALVPSNVWRRRRTTITAPMSARRSTRTITQYSSAEPRSTPQAPAGSEGRITVLNACNVAKDGAE